MNFAYSPERLAAIQRCLSPDRLAYYADRCGDDAEGAIRLYQINTKLSADLYTPLQAIEVAVRNEINEQLIVRFGEDWYSLSSLILEQRHVEDVQEAVREATSYEGGKEIPPTNGQVVAALRFGFWVGILGPKNENEVWRKALYKAFPHRGKGNERKVVHGALDAIRQLRNLVAHHRRIIHRDLETDHNQILQVAGWICPHVRDWIAAHSKFDPSEIPVPQITLPDLGMPPLDEVPPSTPLPPAKPTRNGRARLGIVPSKGENANK